MANSNTTAQSRKKTGKASGKLTDKPNEDERNSFPQSLRPYWLPRDQLADEQRIACDGAAVACALFNLGHDRACWPYVLSAGVLIHSIKQQLGNVAGLSYVALVPAPQRDGGAEEPLALTPDMLRALELQGWTVRPVPYLPEFERQINPHIKKGHHYNYTMGMKIHAFGLSEYKRVLYLDVDSVFGPERKLGDLGCCAELLRMDLGGWSAAASYNAQKALIRMGEKNLRQRNDRLYDSKNNKYCSAAHSAQIPAAFTQFDYPDMCGDPDRRHLGYCMMLTGLMVIQPDPELMREILEVLRKVKTPMYSDGDMLTHALTMVGLNRGQEGGWVGVDMLYGAYRGETQNPPYGIQFGGMPPWLSHPDWSSGKKWRDSLKSLLQHAAANCPELAAVYRAHQWCNVKNRVNVKALTQLDATPEK
jgi:hypothetical protein